MFITESTCHIKTSCGYKSAKIQFYQIRTLNMVLLRSLLRVATIVNMMFCVCFKNLNQQSSKWDDQRVVEADFPAGIANHYNVDH